MIEIYFIHALVDTPAEHLDSLLGRYDVLASSVFISLQLLIARHQLFTDNLHSLIDQILDISHMIVHLTEAHFEVFLQFGYYGLF